ncbi:hypothetical protein [Pseudokineococcus sp. 1T1Z-3]|uniref:hypothetical protein n=1 Tax=Pseudokineococcus sp. 1T1Z-3 TaxID=3132745 RepID=UPI0030A0C733
MDLGDLPTWLGVLVSALALGAAAVAATHAGRVLRIESARDARAEEDRRELQARGVSAWVAVHLDDRGSRQDGFVLHNVSDAPVHDVTVRFLSPDYKGWRDATMLVVPPGRYFTRDGEPTYGWYFPDHVDAYPGTIRPVMKKEQWRVAELTFTDSAGRRWRRDGRGTLSTTPRDG